MADRAMAYPAEVGRSQSEAGFTSRVSFPGKSEIAGASADPARILVINRLFVEALNLLGLSTVEIPRPVLRAVVSEVLRGGPRCGRIDNSHEQQFVGDTTAKSASSWLFYLAGCHRRGPLLLYQRTPRTGLPEAPQPAEGSASNWSTRGPAAGSTRGPDSGSGGGSLLPELSTELVLSQ